MANGKVRIEYHPTVTKSWRDEGHFIISNVNHLGEIATYSLFEKLTPAMNLEQTSEYYEKQKKEGNPIPANSQLIFSIGDSAYNLRNESPGESEQLRNFLYQSLRLFPNAFTSCLYSPDGKDKIIHNPNTSDKYSIDSKIVGPDNWFSKIPDKNILESLLGTSDVNKINQVFQWINKTNGYLWRINDKPKEKNKRVAGFSASDGRLYLDCLRSPRCEYPAFRVLKI